MTWHGDSDLESEIYTQNKGRPHELCSKWFQTKADPLKPLRLRTLKDTAAQMLAGVSGGLEKQPQHTESKNLLQKPVERGNNLKCYW